MTEDQVKATQRQLADLQAQVATLQAQLAAKDDQFARLKAERDELLQDGLTTLQERNAARLEAKRLREVLQTIARASTDLVAANVAARILQAIPTTEKPEP